MLKGAPSDLRGGVGSLFCAGFFLGSVGAARFFFLANAGIFLNGRTFCMNFFPTILSCTIQFFLVTAHPSTRRSDGPSLSKSYLLLYKNAVRETSHPEKL